MDNKMLGHAGKDKTCRLCHGRGKVKIKGQEYPCVCQKTKLLVK